MSVRDYPCTVRYLRDPGYQRTTPEMDSFEVVAWMRDARACIRELQLRVVMLERELASRGLVRLDQTGSGQRHGDPNPDSLIGPD